VSFFQSKQEAPPSLPFQVEPVAFFSPPVLPRVTACEPTPRPFLGKEAGQIPEGQLSFPLVVRYRGVTRPS
jgi:hypothetical protein